MLNIPPIALENGRLIGKGNPVYIIAEVGSNHDGDLERAKMLIREAKKTGADAVKFQSFQAETLINPKKKNEKSWQQDPAWDTLKTLSLPFEWHYELAQEAKKEGIDFLSTPFDLERIELLIELNVPLIKISSGDLTYYELIREAGKSKKPVLLSTGHALLGEVEAALRVLWEVGCKDIVLLHCASIYPADYSDANIMGMVAMCHGFQVQVGYSDHTPGAVVPIGAVAKGACVIEKHLTDSKSRVGPDHAFALELDEFSSMVQHIRHIEAALKGGKKTFRPAEEKERVEARRAIYAKQRISKGEKIERSRIKIVRHAYQEGVPADRWERLDGRAAVKDIEKDEMITWDMV